MAKRMCSIEGCGRPFVARDRCSRHYQRWARANPTIRVPKLSAEARFWAKVDKDGPIPEYRPDLGSCWIWLGGRTEGQYGQLQIATVQKLAHRVAYEWVVGPIPAGLTLRPKWPSLVS